MLQCLQLKDTILVQLPTESPKEQLVCVGSEWHRFPSAFFLPGPSYRLAFLPSGFGGLLPHAFNTSQARHRRGCPAADSLRQMQHYCHRLASGMHNSLPVARCMLAPQLTTGC